MPLESLHRGITLLVCGGRDYKDYRKVRHTLDDLHAIYRIDLLVHGAAGNRKLTYNCPGQQMSGDWRRVLEGADLFAEEWAHYNRVPSWPYPVEPVDWRAWGTRAGPMRNRRMLDERRPDLCVAFPGGRGTADMVRQARDAGVEVLEVKS